PAASEIVPVASHEPSIETTPAIVAHLNAGWLGVRRHAAPSSDDHMTAFDNPHVSRQSVPQATKAPRESTARPTAGTASAPGPESTVRHADPSPDDQTSIPRK